MPLDRQNTTKRNRKRKCMQLKAAKWNQEHGK